MKSNDVRESKGVMFRVTLGVLVLVGSVLGLSMMKKTPPVATHTIAARLELAAGDVTLKRGSDWPTVISGLPLPEGAELATGKGSRALVRLSDGSAVFLRGGSQIALGTTGVRLEKGEMWLDAPVSERGGLTHTLGDVTVSAADAGLSLTRDDAGATVYVTRGLAVVNAPGGRVEVNAGEQAVVKKGEAPKVAALKYWEDWTGGMGDHRPFAGEGAGSGRIYGIDQSAPPGTPARTLEISRQVVRATLRDGLAETEVDQTFGNPGGREVEGWYWFTVPERAIVTSFAVETDGVLIEGEVIEQKEAAQKYAQAVKAAHEPALLEWVDGKTYRARIFPVPASGSRRVVLRYLEMLDVHGGEFSYVYPLRGSANDPTTIGELSLSIDLGDAGVNAPISTLADAVIEEGGRKVTMRRSGFTPRADFQIEGKLHTQDSPFRVARYSAGGDRADYVMARYVPDTDWASLKEQPADLVVVVDTSASADDAARQQKTAAAEAVLRALSPQDHFALVALDSAPVVLYPKDKDLTEASEKEIATAMERLAEHATGGATDLGSLFDVALGRVHGKEQPAVIYIGDGIPTSGEITAEKLTERLRRSLASSRARFFTVAVGTEANHPLLHELSRAGGGQSFRIDDVEGSTREVLRLASAIKTPTITDLSIDLGAGLDEPMLTASGKVTRGEEVVLLARTHHALPTEAVVKGRLAGTDFEKRYRIEADAGVGTALVPRLWAAEKIRRLLGSSAEPDEHRGKIVELGVEYALVTPFTSILALESEQAYQQQGIQRRGSPLRGVRLTALTPEIERETLDVLGPHLGLGLPHVAMGCASESRPSSENTKASVAAGPAVREKSSFASSPFAAATAEAPPPPAPAPGVAASAAVASTGDIPPGAVDKSVADGFGMGGSLSAFGNGHGRLGGDIVTKSAGGRAPKALDSEGVSTNAIAAAPPRPAERRIAVTRGRGAEDAPDLQHQKRGGNDARTKGETQEKEAKEDAAKLALKSAPKDRGLIKTTPIMLQCSDSARRPLSERVVVWYGRLRRASTADELIARYEGARATCEVPDWRAQSALLDLIQEKVRNEGAADALLGHFAGERETQKFIAHSILRRSVDPAVVAVVRRVLFSDRARWTEIDNDLSAVASADERVARLRQILVSYPDDPEGEIRLVRALAEADKKDEALAMGRRLRERGFMSPALALTLGDVMASSGFQDDAIRTYSEIVEFDPGSAQSRRLLGDVYLRHGWYPSAYRQYKTLTDIAAADPVSWLRLAGAAAGSGRVDEALRIDRQVSSAEGTPGPNDPRVWARLLSASRLAELLDDKSAPAGQAESVSRKLKELQVLNAPAALQILTWEDFDAALSLAGMDGVKETPIGEVTNALPVGLHSRLVPTADLERLRWVARWSADPPGRDVAFVLHTIVWDGKAFHVTVKRASLGQKAKEVAL